MSTPAPATSWWPLSRKMQFVVAGLVSAESAATVGELTTGTPGWGAILVGALVAIVGAVSGYSARETPA